MLPRSRVTDASDQSPLTPIPSPPAKPGGEGGQHDSLLTLDNIGVTLGGRPVLRGVTTSIRRSQITALLGLNGSGKTTLLRAILGEVERTGAIRFHCGHDHSLPYPTHIGYVPQKLSVDARLPLTVRDLFALALQRWPLFLGVRPHVERKAGELLDRVWTPRRLLSSPVEKLSGGELQRVLLALALEPAPELLLLDEPAAGVDFQHQSQFYDLLADLNRTTGVTVVLVSHELDAVTRHAHRVVCLKDGRVECEGAPAEILTVATLAATFGGVIP